MEAAALQVMTTGENESARMTGQEEITAALKETLRRTGTLHHVRATLRADIYHCLTDCLTKENNRTPTPPPENILINEVIADYLAFNGYLNTLSVLATESGTPSLLDVTGTTRQRDSIDSSLRLGSEFIRAELGLREGSATCTGRRRTPLAMLYEIVQTLKARRILQPC